MKHCVHVSLYISWCIQIILIVLPRMVQASTREQGSSLYQQVHRDNYNWSIQVIRDHYRIVEVCIHIQSMAINVYENGKGGKCVHRWMHAYV